MSEGRIVFDFCLWSVLVLYAGIYWGMYIARNTKLKKGTVLINSLSFKQAVKFIWVHEQRRHQQDIDGITTDLKVLKDVELPKEAEELAGKIRFDV